MKKKISLKAKVTLTAIILFIVSFAAMSFVSLHFMEDLISEHMIAQFINEDTQLAKQVSILLEKGADTQELQSFVEDCVAQNEHYAYAVAIDTTVTAVAHSDVEKIGKSYLDDTAYTVPASQNGDVMTSQFWADVHGLMMSCVLSMSTVLYGARWTSASTIIQLIPSSTKFEKFLSLWH